MTIGVCLIGFAILFAIKPLLAERFPQVICEFSAGTYAEQASCLIGGAAIVIFAPSMWFPDLLKFLDGLSSLSP